MTGDRFEVYKQDGRWHWRLEKSNSPHAVMARSRPNGYASESAARAIKSACEAAIGMCGGTYRMFDGEVNPRTTVIG